MPAKAEKKNLVPHDHIAAWARGHEHKKPLRSQFIGSPRSVSMKTRAGVDELKEILGNLNAPPRTMERALDESATGETVSVWTVSNEAVDSYKTTFKPDGWDLEHFTRNPVVLFAHDRSAPPIGRDVGAWIDPGKALMGVTRYTPASMNPFGAAIGEMVRGGFLNAVSVGFEALEFEVDKGRDDGESFFIPVNFLRARLHEYSVVPVPSNPEALHEGRSFIDALREEGVDIRPVREWCERFLDGELPEGIGALTVPRLWVERAHKGIVRVGDGNIVLAPASRILAEGASARAEGDAPFAADGGPPGDDAATGEDHPVEGDGLCPSCGFEAPLAEFAVAPEEPEPTEEELRTLGAMSTRALLVALEARGLGVVSAGAQVDPPEDEVSESFIDQIAQRVAETTARVAERELINRTGRLPGAGA